MWPAPLCPPHEGCSALAIVFSTEAISHHTFEVRGGDHILAAVAVVERRSCPRRGPVWPGGCNATTTPSAPGIKPRQGACSAHGSLHVQPAGQGRQLGAFNLFLKPRLPLVGSPLAAMLFRPDRAFLLQACSAHRPRWQTTPQLPPEWRPLVPLGSYYFSPTTVLGDRSWAAACVPKKSRHPQVIPLRGSSPWTAKLSKMAGRGKYFNTQYLLKPQGPTGELLKKKKNQMNPFNQSSSPQATTHSIIFLQTKNNCFDLLGPFVPYPQFFTTTDLPWRKQLQCCCFYKEFYLCLCWSDTSPGHEYLHQQDRTDLTLTPSLCPALLLTAGRRKEGRNPTSAMPSYKISPLMAEITILPHSKYKCNFFFSEGPSSPHLTITSLPCQHTCHLFSSREPVTGMTVQPARKHQEKQHASPLGLSWAPGYLPGTRLLHMGCRYCAFGRWNIPLLQWCKAPLYSAKGRQLSEQSLPL